VDGLGKPYASIAPGDKELGSAAVSPWLVSGLTTLNAKGAAVESCESMPISSPVMDPEELIDLQEERRSALGAELPLGRWNCGKQDFDEFGRAITTYSPSDHPEAEDGYVISKAVYHVDSGDSYDHLDLFDSENQGT
jgi:hypothetical protein